MSFSISLRKGRHVGHLHWDSMIKGSTVWVNMYSAKIFGMGDTIYEKYRKMSTAIVCPTRVPWFSNFMRSLNVRTEVNKNNTF